MPRPLAHHLDSFDRPAQRIANRVAIVDDDPASRRALARFFQRHGWTVMAVGTGNDCLRDVATARPSHAILEQRLPDGSGLGLLGELKRLDPDMVVVIVTRYASVAAAVTAIRCGASNYLSKPVTPSQIVRALTTPPEKLWEADENVEETVRGASFEPKSSLARLEWDHLHGVVQDCDGNVSEAARALGIQRRSLQRKLARRRPHR
jgi:two-component system response regulator RegA